MTDLVDLGLSGSQTSANKLLLGHDIMDILVGVGSAFWMQASCVGTFKLARAWTIDEAEMPMTLEMKRPKGLRESRLVFLQGREICEPAQFAIHGNFISMVQMQKSCCVSSSRMKPRVSQ